jgi:hypothetical protein
MTSRRASKEVISVTAADAGKLKRSSSTPGTVSGISLTSVSDDLAMLDPAMSQFSDDWLFPLSAN